MAKIEFRSAEKDRQNRSQGERLAQMLQDEKEGKRPKSSKGTRHPFPWGMVIWGVIVGSIGGLIGWAMSESGNAFANTSTSAALGAALGLFIASQLRSAASVD